MTNMTYYTPPPMRLPRHVPRLGRSLALPASSAPLPFYLRIFTNFRRFSRRPEAVLGQEQGQHDRAGNQQQRPLQSDHLGN